MFLVLISTALALEGLHGAWLPGASPLAARQGWVGAGAAWDWSGPGDHGQGMLLRGVVGAGPRLALNIEGNLNQSELISDLQIGLRRNVWSRDGIHLAHEDAFSFAKLDGGRAVTDSEGGRGGDNDEKSNSVSPSSSSSYCSSWSFASSSEDESVTQSLSLMAKDERM